MHTAVNPRVRRSVSETRVYRGACRTGEKKAALKKYEVTKLEVPGVRRQFTIELKNRFSCLTVQNRDGRGW